MVICEQWEEGSYEDNPFKVSLVVPSLFCSLLPSAPRGQLSREF